METAPLYVHAFSLSNKRMGDAAHRQRHTMLPQALSIVSSAICVLFFQVPLIHRRISFHLKKAVPRMAPKQADKARRTILSNSNPAPDSCLVTYSATSAKGTIKQAHQESSQAAPNTAKNPAPTTVVEVGARRPTMKSTRTPMTRWSRFLLCHHGAGVGVRFSSDSLRDPWVIARLIDC